MEQYVKCTKMEGAHRFGQNVKVGAAAASVALPERRMTALLWEKRGMEVRGIMGEQRCI